MAQHISRKDLKKDEIRETLVSGVESVASHQQAMWIVIIGGAGGGAGCFGLEHLCAAADGARLPWRWMMG